MSGSPIIVGINDSPAAQAALLWAAQEANTEHRPLKLVCAYRWMVRYDPVPMFRTIAVSDREKHQIAAETAIAQAMLKADELTDGVEIDGAAIDGEPLAVLVKESEEASLIVVGSGPRGGAFLGSVSAGLTTRAACPVIVVRDLPESDGAVIAGVDATSTSQEVLQYAFDYADRHHRPLRAVLCWHPEPMTAMTWANGQVMADTWMSETLAGWQEKYPDVVVHSRVSSDHPTHALTEQSHGQHLLVVGRRSPHTFATAVLGSVSQGVLHHAQCAVAIVPHA